MIVRTLCDIHGINPHLTRRRLRVRLWNAVRYYAPPVALLLGPVLIAVGVMTW